MQQLNEVFTPKVIAKIKQQRVMREFKVDYTGTSVRCIVYKNNIIVGIYDSLSLAGRDLDIKQIRLSNNLRYGTAVLEGNDRYDVNII